MSTPLRGHKTAIQFGRETLFGAPAVATHRLEVLSENITPDIGFIRDPSLYDGLSRRAIYPGSLSTVGTFTTRGNYNGLGLLWDCLMGTAVYANNGGSATGVGPFKWTFTPKSLLNSLSFQIPHGGDIAGETGGYVRVTGAVIPAVTIRVRAGSGDEAMMSMEWEVYGSTMSVQTSGLTAVPATPAVDPIIFTQMTTALGPSVGAPETNDVRIKELEIRITTPIDRERRYLGSSSPDIPIRNDFFAPTYRITMEAHSREQLKSAIAVTKRGVGFKFTNGAAAAALRSLLFASSDTNATSFTAPVENYGIVTQTVEWEAVAATAAGSATTLYEGQGINDAMVIVADLSLGGTSLTTGTV